MKESNDQINTDNEDNEEDLKPSPSSGQLKYKCPSKKTILGRGSFGNVYLFLNNSTNEEVAIKVELMDSENSSLKNEYKIYKALEGEHGFPKIYEYTTVSKYNVLVMEVLGDSIEDLLNKAEKHFSFLTILMIIEQIITRIEYMHKKNFIHRDIKPGNFMIGRGKKRNVIYAIDFGLSKKYRSSSTGLHIRYRDGKDLAGTPIYVSVNTHLGIEQARRDDIEAIGYMMIYLMKGYLPWQGGPKDNPKKKNDGIKNLKIRTELSVLCQGLPNECIDFIQYARNMRFDDKPDYKYLRHLLKKMALKKGLNWDTSQFDWLQNKE